MIFMFRIIEVVIRSKMVVRVSGDRRRILNGVVKMSSFVVDGAVLKEYFGYRIEWSFG